MKRILSIPIYIWAIISGLILPITFVGSSFFAKELATLPFMRVNPTLSGGDSLKTIQQDSLYITINRPVFDALFGESKKGFVQIKLTAKGKLPAVMHPTIDYNGDGRSDFGIRVNTATGETVVEPFSSEVLGLAVSSKVKDYWIVRVNLRNPSK